MDLERRSIAVSRLSMNEGQVEGLPCNPRGWTKEEVARLQRSIQETPSLLEARGLIVYPLGDKFVVLGGNLRLCAAKALGLKEVPCIVYPKDTPLQTLKEVALKDNGSFGMWDYDALANEWDELPLNDWGIPAWNTSAEDDEEDTQEPQEEKEQGASISIDIPAEWAFLVDVIRLKVQKACAEWKGCKVR